MHKLCAIPYAWSKPGWFAAGEVLDASYISKETVSNAPAGRTAGIVLHPTSLPGGYGTGDLGKECRQFVDWLASAGMKAWQVLPPLLCIAAFNMQCLVAQRSL